MTKKIRIDVVIFLLVSAIIIASLSTALIINNKVSQVSEVESAFSKIKYIDDIVEENYIGSIDSETLTDGIARGYIEGLMDTYAEYYTAEEYSEYTKLMSGEYTGIGLTVAWKDDNLYVIHLCPESPAALSGMQVGDRIVSVDGIVFDELSHSDVEELLDVSIGKISNIEVKRGGEQIICTVTSAPYEQTSVDYKLMGYVGYIFISTFNDLTPEQFGDAVDDLISQGAKNLIIDVRFNTGGSIDSVVSCVDRIVSTGTVATAVYKRSEDEKEVTKISYDAVTEECVDIPVIVLCNKSTASGGELFVAALNDFGKATTVGNTTYGKGTGQSFYKLPDGSYIKLTDFTYYPPSGSGFNLIGYTPTVLVDTGDKEEADFLIGSYANDVYITTAFQILGVDSGVLSTVEK